MPILQVETSYQTFLILHILFVHIFDPSQNDKMYTKSSKCTLKRSVTSFFENVNIGNHLVLEIRPKKKIVAFALKWNY